MKKVLPLPTKDELRATFDYRSDGNLLWKHWGSGVRGRRKQIAGDQPTKTCHYRKVSISGDKSSKRALLHRLIWVWHNGAIPSGMWVDHIDRNKQNNRIENLRLTDWAGNQRNTPAKNKSGLPKHVFKTANGRYAVIIRIGTFDTAMEAGLRAEQAVKLLHPTPPAMRVRGPIS